MHKDSEIQIRGGRHPLQELCCSPFVPNDTDSGGSDGKIKILTGPNACGKSVYIKQVMCCYTTNHMFFLSLLSVQTLLQMPKKN